VFSRKVDVDRVCEVGNFRGNHVGWSVGGEELVAGFAPPLALADFGDLTAAVFTHARCIKDALVVFYSGNVAVHEVEVVLIGIVFVLQSVIDLANYVEIAALAILIAVFASSCQESLLLSGAITSVLLLGQVSEILNIVLASLSGF
jgi:hypothetical protein